MDAGFVVCFCTAIPMRSEMIEALATYSYWYAGYYCERLEIE